MEFTIRLELSFYYLPVSAGLRRLQKDPTVARVLKQAIRGVPRLDHEAVFYIRDDDSELLRVLLAKLLAYEEDGGFGYVPLPEHRSSEDERRQADYLLMQIDRFCDEFGDTYGTPYDRSRWCSECGAGAVVQERLVIPRRGLSWLRSGFAKASFNEVVVGNDVVRLLAEHDVHGYRTLPVVAPRDRSQLPMPWGRHLQFTEECGPLPARNLVDPGERCSRYSRDSPHRPGHGLLSPLHLLRHQAKGDMFVTRDHFGLFMGHVLPGPLIVVSQRIYRLLSEARVEGVAFEPVILIDGPDDGVPCGGQYDSLTVETADIRFS